MPDPNPPGDLPPDLPPEYADAYRRAYERALTGGEESQAEETQRLEGYERLFAPDPPRRSYDGPTHRDDIGHRRDRPAWLVPALFGGLVVLLILGAYGLGLLFSSSVEDADVSTEEPDGVVLGEGGSSAPSRPESPGGDPQRGRYDGRTEATTVGGATASCESAPSVDAAGNQVRYAPANSYDGDLTTAWRCDGDGVGQTLTLSLTENVEVGEVGLVPGYAKTDPRSGADRYAENNRITRVRWTFSDGSSIVQRLDGSATNRELQTVRIPLTDANQVEIEVLASTQGSRNTIAVSEIRIGAAAD